MALLDDVKLELRVSGTTFDTEIQGLIDACKIDLEESGVLKVVESEKLTRLAIIIYCKANFGWDNPEANRFMQSYESIRTKLTLAKTFNAFKITFTVTHAAVPVKDAQITIDDVNGTILTTNSLGVANYYTYDKEVDIDYTVSHSSYSAVTGSVYVDNDESVAVSI